MTDRIRSWASFAALDRLIVWTTGIAIIALMAGMVGSVVLAVFFRYVLASALPWPEEFARFAMIWVTMLGAGLVLRYQGHIAVLFVVEALPERLRTIVTWVGRILVGAFLILLLVKGTQFLGIVARQTAPAMGISMIIPNFAVPLGALLMLYHLFVRSFAPDLRPPPLPLVGDEEHP